MFQNLVCQFSDEQQAFIVKGKLEKGLRKLRRAPVQDLENFGGLQSELKKFQGGSSLDLEN